METPKFFEVKKDGKEDKTQEKGQSFGFVEKQRDFFEHYTKDKVQIVEGDENSFNFITKKITIDPKRYEGLDFSEEMTLHSVLHEIEHFDEDVQLLSENGGEKVFDKLLKKLEQSRAYGLMNNSLADIRENKAVISKTNKGMVALEKKKITEKLFSEINFTQLPKHIQLCYSLFRENRVDAEKCNVSPEVRTMLDEVAKNKKLMDIMTHPKTPMSMRLKLQDKYIWPKVEALLEKDIEDENNNEEQDGEESEDKGDGDGENNENTDQGGEKDQNGEKQEGKKEEQSKDEKDDKDAKKEKSKGNSEKSDTKPFSAKGSGEAEENDPNKIFSDEYEKAEKKFPNVVPTEEVKKALQEWKEEKQKNDPDKIDQEYADKLGVEKKDLQEYRKIAEELEKIVNPETNVGVLEELKNLFSRIIAKRMRERLSPRYPVEEGDELADPAQLVSDVKSGNLQPKVWEDTEIKEKKGDKFGEVEITLVCDRSSSMTDGNGQKAVEQRKSAVLMMEVLKDFAEMCDEEKMKVDKPLEIKSEVYSFASDEEDRIPLKKMSKDLGEAERINVLKKLNHLPGSTTDFNCLEAVNDGLDDETKKKITGGELKKIVFVFTDGGSDSVARVQNVLQKLRKDGVVVIGVGLTSAGAPAKTTYAPNAEVVENITNLPVVLGDLLKEHLKDI